MSITHFSLLTLNPKWNSFQCLNDPYKSATTLKPPGSLMIVSVEAAVTYCSHLQSPLWTRRARLNVVGGTVGCVLQWLLIKAAYKEAHLHVGTTASWIYWALSLQPALHAAWCAAWNTSSDRGEENGTFISSHAVQCSSFIVGQWRHAAMWPLSTSPLSICKLLLSVA